MIFFRKWQLTAVSLLCLSSASLFGAVEGNWVTPTSGTTQWFNGSSWSSDPNIPGSTLTGGDIANFFFNSTGQLVLQTNPQQTVVLGTLNLNIGGVTNSTHSFSPTSFEFNSGTLGIPASINLVGGFSVDMGSVPIFGVTTPITLSSPLLIDIEQSGFLGMYYSITGNQPITITGFGDVTPQTGSGFLQVPANSVVDTGLITLNNVRYELWNNALIKGNVTVNSGAFLFPHPTNGLADNHFSPTTTNVTLDGGTFLINNSPVQSFNSLTIYNAGQAVTGTSTVPPVGVPGLTLNSSSVALNMKGGSFLIPNLFLPNGGSIAYTPSLPDGGEAIIGGPEGIFIDLGGHNVSLAIGDGSNALGRVEDMTIRNATIVSGSLTKVLSGTLLFKGPTSIPSLALQQGRVLAGRAPADVMSITSNELTVLPGSALGGFGQLGTGAMVVTNQGLVEPGSEGLVGTLTIAGDYIQNPNGTLLIKVAGRTADRLTVTGGGVSLCGGTLKVEGNSHSFQNGDRVVVVDNNQGTGICGNFGCFLEHISDDLLVKYVVQPKQIFLEFFPSPEAEIAAVELSQIALIDRHNINLLTRMRSVRDRFVTMEWRDDMALRAENDSLKQPFSLKGRRNDTHGFIAVQPESEKPIRSGSFWKKPAENRSSVYIAPFGSWGDVDPIKVQRGFDFHSYGGLLGGDYAFDSAGIGAFIGYEHLKGDVDCQFGDFKYEMLFGQLYGTFLPLKNRNLFLDLILGGTRNWYTFNRNSDCLVATGKPKGWDWDGYAGLGYDFHFKKEWRLTPIFGFQYIRVQMDGFTEDGACDENLCVASQKLHSSRTWLGGSFGGKLERQSVTWVPEVRGYWQYEFAPLSHCVQVASPCDDFCDNIRIYTGDRNYGIVGAELRALFGHRKNWSLAGAYDYYWSKSTQVNFAYLELGYNW